MRKLGLGFLISLAAGLLVGVAPAGATDVSDEAGLRAAFDADSQIDLLNDITLADCQEGDLNRNAAAPVTIDGHGFTITQTCSDNILEPDQSDVQIVNLTLTGGQERDDGGAIDMNGGNLSVIDSTISGNCAADSAGAIENEDDTTTIIRSTLTGNEAGDQAGAIRSKRGDTRITNSTITGNSQAVAGAVDSGQQDSTEATLSIVYSTIVENSIDQEASCEIMLTADTEGDDTDDDAGPEGLPVVANINAVDAIEIFGTVVALPNGGPNCNVVNPGSLGYNFSDDDTCGFTATGDTENGGDPVLGALADNGGPTQTRLPGTGSPLIDAIPLDACDDGDGVTGPGIVDTDQRGVSRPQGAGCDIGAVEVEATTTEPPPPPAAEPAAVTPTFTG